LNHPFDEQRYLNYADLLSRDATALIGATSTLFGSQPNALCSLNWLKIGSLTSMGIILPSSLWTDNRSAKI